MKESKIQLVGAKTAMNGVLFFLFEVFEVLYINQKLRTRTLDSDFRVKWRQFQIPHNDTAHYIVIRETIFDTDSENDRQSERRQSDMQM